MMLDAAIDYVRAGLPIFPVRRDKQPYTPHGFKDATKDESQIVDWWKQWPEAGIGMPTGTPSGRLVVDIDPRNGGDKSLAVLEEQYGALPATLESKTGGGGRHLFFSCRDRSFRKCTLSPGIDIQSEGAYVVLPPSSHPSGNRYEWLGNSATIPLEPPRWFENLLLAARSQAKDASGTTAASKIPPGRRNGHLTSSGSMRHRGMSADAILAALRCENDLRCDPPLQLGELQNIAKSVGRYEPAATNNPVPAVSKLRRRAVSRRREGNLPCHEKPRNAFKGGSGLTATIQWQTRHKV